ncbi:hypothetical protein SKAU_G00253380 [Synaphobranchus kaupii]|uniref:Uncharacterized protein n=1 Tax=Synaphobranchus kaupii TaxID=118154 RepID=A0A9Q1F3B0_SYNKA|nr:hypothetical protein SKAU_G00253380 [Synaphobranchus kaupii]
MPRTPLVQLSWDETQEEPVGHLVFCPSPQFGPVRLLPQFRTTAEWDRSLCLPLSLFPLETGPVPPLESQFGGAINSRLKASYIILPGRFLAGLTNCAHSCSAPGSLSKGCQIVVQWNLPQLSDLGAGLLEPDSQTCTGEPWRAAVPRGLCGNRIYLGLEKCEGEGLTQLNLVSYTH